MQSFLPLLGAVPALVAMFYFDRLDAKRPEPRWTLRKVSIAGGLSVIPAIVIEVLLDKVGPHGGYPGGIYKGFVVAGATEELCKLMCVLWFAWKRPEFDERMDGITYGTRAGLGFALVENIGYLFGAKTMGAFIGMFIVRALLSVPGHAIYAGIMGYCAALRRFDKRGPGIIGGYLIAVFLHGAYDAALFSCGTAHQEGQDALILLLLPIPLLITIVGAIVLRKMAKKAIAADDAEEAARRPAAWSGEPPRMVG